MGAAGTFSQSRFRVLIDGVPVTGLADGDDAVQVTFSRDEVEHAEGVDGEGMFSIRPGNPGEVMIKLLPGSKSNQYLQSKLQAQRLVPSTSITVSVTDFINNASYVARQGRIAGAPGRQYGTAAGDVEWKIKAHRIDDAPGGRS